MKLQVTQENLSKALNTVARVATSRNTLPILSNVLLKTVDNRLSIAATNLDIAITHYIGSKLTTEGAITVPARLMQDFVSSLPSGVISLELDEYKLRISTDQYKSVINGVSSDEYPVMPTISKGKTWKVNGHVLKQALQQVIGVASSDESRPILTAVYLYTLEGNVYIAATDSYRLAEKHIVTNHDDDIQLLIPASSMHDLLRIVSDFNEDVEVIHDDQQILFRVGDVELVTRLIDGKYPDYRKLIPKSFSVSATLKRSEFVNVTKVSSLFARESAGSVTIHLDEESQTLSIRSIASQLGENTATAQGTISGTGDITLNSRYLLEALQAFHGEEIIFGFNGKLDPSVLEDKNNPDYIHVIMPLKS